MTQDDHPEPPAGSTFNRRDLMKKTAAGFAAALLGGGIRRRGTLAEQDENGVLDPPPPEMAGFLNTTPDISGFVRVPPPGSDDLIRTQINETVFSEPGDPGKKRRLLIAFKDGVTDWSENNFYPPHMTYDAFKEQIRAMVEGELGQEGSTIELAFTDISGVDYSYVPTEPMLIVEATDYVPNGNESDTSNAIAVAYPAPQNKIQINLADPYFEDNTKALNYVFWHEFGHNPLGLRHSFRDIVSVRVNEAGVEETVTYNIPENWQGPPISNMQNADDYPLGLGLWNRQIINELAYDGSPPVGKARGDTSYYFDRSFDAIQVINEPENSGYDAVTLDTGCHISFDPRYASQIGDGYLYMYEGGGNIEQIRLMGGGNRVVLGPKAASSRRFLLHGSNAQFFLTGDEVGVNVIDIEPQTEIKPNLNMGSYLFKEHGGVAMTRDGDTLTLDFGGGHSITVNHFDRLNQLSFSLLSTRPVKSVLITGQTTQEELNAAFQDVHAPSASTDPAGGWASAVSTNGKSGGSKGIG